MWLLMSTSVAGLNKWPGPKIGFVLAPSARELMQRGSRQPLHTPPFPHPQPVASLVRLPRIIRISWYNVQQTVSYLHILLVEFQAWCINDLRKQVERRWLSSGLLLHVVWYKFTDVSEVR
jgi:hypothetical protein